MCERALEPARTIGFRSDLRCSPSKSIGNKSGIKVGQLGRFLLTQSMSRPS
jgi:hypothetical protein